MADLESALLNTLVAFARSRLNALVASNDPETLLGALLGHAPSQAQLDQLQAKRASVQNHLAQAAASLAALTADLQAGAFNQAASDLAAALSEMHAAVRDIASVVPEVGDAEAALLALIRKAVAAGGAAASGLVAQLGLAGGASIPDAIDLAGSVVSFHATNAAARTAPGPPGVRVVLRDSVLSAALDYAARPPVLGLTLTTSVRAGLAADGLVQQVLGSADASVDVVVVIGLDTARGLTFGAGLRHRVSIPGDLRLPGVELRELGLEAPQDGTTSLELTGTLKGKLGDVVNAVVEGAGVRLRIDGGAVAVEVRAPVGAGLAVNAAAIRGGGYLSKRGAEYGGVLDLRLGPIEMTAIGLVQTAPHVSMVVLLAVEFTPAIQLSFGFTLNAVGGLLAIERAIDTDALRAALHQHTLDLLLFPRDPVQRAPSILDALRTVFPPHEGGFVVGPMFELGWGTPISFVTARLGVLLALPDPKLILLGLVRVTLPAPQVPIIDLRADIYGEITPDRVLVFGSLDGSRLAMMPMTGDIGVLLGFGGNPEMAISAGGFHPRFRPPRELLGMRRLNTDLSPPSFITLRTETYFALTTNSVQFGAFVELRGSVASVGAEAHLGFDAIVLWAPRFHFEFDLVVGASIFAFGETFAHADLHLHLEGPGPWVARGRAEISVPIFPDIVFDLPTIRWGGDPAPPPEPVSPLQLVATALKDDAAWAAPLPVDANRLFRFRDAVATDAGVLLVHPLGGFELRQRVVPLETVIDRVGRNPVSEKRVNLGEPRVGQEAAHAVSHVKDQFAPGQFLDLTDDQKLSRPSFEERPAGARFASTGMIHGTPVTTEYRWDTVYPHRPDLGRHKHLVVLSDYVKAVVIAAGMVAQGSQTRTNPYVTLESTPLQLADPGTVQIRRTHDLGLFAGIPSGPMSTTEAARIIEDAAVANPQLEGTLQLVAIGATS